MESNNKEEMYTSGKNITEKEMYRFIADYNSHGTWMEPTLTVKELVKMFEERYGDRTIKNNE